MSPTSSTPAASRAIDSITASEISSRARRLIGGQSGLPAADGGAIAVGARLAAALVGAQHVAEAAHGPEQPGLGAVELAPQVADVRLDDVVLAVEVVLPDVVEDLLLRQDALGVEQEVAQQPELGGRQLDLVVAAPDLVAVLVHLEVAVAEAGVGAVAAADAAQERPDAERQLLERERLGDVVVAAAHEARDPVVLGVARGQEDHRDEVAGVAEPPADLEAVDVGEHDVEHDEVGGGRCCGDRARRAPRTRWRRVAHVAQGRREEIGDRGLVVHDQDVRGTRGRDVHGRISRSVAESFL